MEWRKRATTTCRRQPPPPRRVAHDWLTSLLTSHDAMTPFHYNDRCPSKCAHVRNNRHTNVSLETSQCHESEWKLFADDVISRTGSEAIPCWKKNFPRLALICESAIRNGLNWRRFMRCHLPPLRDRKWNEESVVESVLRRRTSVRTSPTWNCRWRTVGFQLNYHHNQWLKFTRCCLR